MLHWRGMARRPDVSEYDKPMTRDEVRELSRHLSTLDPFRVERFYQQAFERSRMHGGLLPRAAAVQELVVAWKVLRLMKRRRPQGRG